MTATMPTLAPARTSTGGAWLGLGIAARAALSVVMSILSLAMVSAIPLVVDFIQRRADSAEFPPQAGKVLDLMLDAAAILGPYARIVGLSGIAIGCALFLAAAMLVRGSEIARRATRLLLVAEAIHSIGAATWMTVLSCTAFGEWNLRYQQAVIELMDVLPNRGGRMPLSIAVPTWMNAVFYGFWGLSSAGVALVLFWLAGRPFVREWCAARRARSPIASRPGPR